MRDRVLKKAETKVKKDGKNTTNSNAENEQEGILRDKNGDIYCCIPMVACNKRGHPLPESLEDGGVKLCCTNNCAYAKHFVHPECFESLEQGLNTMLSKQRTGKKGMIKAWLESQAEVQLWSKRGLEFIQKTIRCPCGKGQMYRDEDAWIKRQQLFDPLCDKKDKKFKLKEKLPALTVAVKKGAAPPPDFHQIDNHYLSSHSPPPSKKSFDIDDKYAPPPPPQPKPRKPSVDDTAVSKPPPTVSKPAPASKPLPTVKKAAAPVKPPAPKPVQMPVKKVPIGYAPVEEFPPLVEEPPKLREVPKPIVNQPVKPKAAEVVKPIVIQSNISNMAKPKSPELSRESLLNKWKQPPTIEQKARSVTPIREPPPPKPVIAESAIPNRFTVPPKSINVESKTMDHCVPSRTTTNLEPKMQNLIAMNETVQPKIQRFMNDIEQFRNNGFNDIISTTPERATSPTNTTSSDTSSSKDFYRSSSTNQRVSIAVQTEESSFPLYPAFPPQRYDSGNYDSGNNSSINSPSFADSFGRPTSFNKYYADDRLNGDHPRGFSYPSRLRQSSDRSSTFGNDYYKEEMDSSSRFAYKEQMDSSPKVTFLFKNRSYAIEVYQDGTKEKIRNDKGYIWTPMYLSMTEGGPHFGEKAQNDYEEFPNFVIYDVMKVIGKPWNEIQRNPKWGFQLLNVNGTICFDIATPTDRKPFPQELVLAMFMKIMKRQADPHLRTPVNKINISTDFALTELQERVFENALGKLKLDMGDFDTL